MLGGGNKVGEKKHQHNVQTVSFFCKDWNDLIECLKMDQVCSRTGLRLDLDRSLTIKKNFMYFYGIFSDYQINGGQKYRENYLT